MTVAMGTISYAVGYDLNHVVYQKYAEIAVRRAVAYIGMYDILG